MPENRLVTAPRADEYDAFDYAGYRYQMSRPASSRHSAQAAVHRLS
jgi:hypothetical protein